MVEPAAAPRDSGMKGPGSRDMGEFRRETPASSARWYAVHTLPRLETTAAAHLVRQGWEVFLPQIRATRRHARRVETIAAPLFPRYGFVRLDLARDRWRSVNGTIGVAGLVMGRDLPSAAPVGVVEELIEAQDSDGFVNLVHGFQPGDPVRIRLGPLEGQMGTLLRLDAKGRVEMLLSLISGKVRLKLARELLEPVR